MPVQKGFFDLAGAQSGERGTSIPRKVGYRVKTGTYAVKSRFKPFLDSNDFSITFGFGDLLFKRKLIGERRMKTAYHISRILVVMIIAVVFLGCAEAKIGIGPFKAVSLEVGPGGVEAKGPSAGPLKTKSVEVGPRDTEDK